MDIMLDLETLANTPNSVIVQIAAVVFNRENGDVIDKFKINVDADSCIRNGMIMNVDTIEWWMKQSDAARKSIFEKPKEKIWYALEKFSDFVINSWVKVYDKEIKNFETRDVKIWCHASFDEPVLSNAYNKTGLEELWHYRGVRDLRTLVDLADYKIDYSKNTGVAHDAIDDYLFQIKYTVECLNKVKMRG